MKRLSKKELNERKHFDTLAEGYDYNYQYNKPLTKYKIDKKSNEFIRIVRQHLRRENLKVLEFGCGTGEYTRHLAKRMPKSKIIGLDISKEIIKIAKKKCSAYSNTSFVVQSAYDTRFKRESFDAICGFYVLHHLDIKKVGKEITRILKPGGILFFYEPNIINPVVYLIKSSKKLKHMVGDSPDEWAINPLTIKTHLPSFDILEISQSEFVWPLKFIPISIFKIADNITSYFRYFPLIKYLGGSVRILAKKNEPIESSKKE